LFDKWINVELFFISTFNQCSKSESTN